MNHYFTSSGIRVSKSYIDKRVREAKEKKLQIHNDIYGYFFCTTCKSNECKPIDCAHIISVDEAQKSGRAELAWDLSNIVIEGRGCHQKRDRLNLQFN